MMSKRKQGVNEYVDELLEELEELNDIEEFEKEQEREAIQVDKENYENDLFDYYCLSLQK